MLAPSEQQTILKEIDAQRQAEFKYYGYPVRRAFVMSVKPPDVVREKTLRLSELVEEIRVISAEIHEAIVDGDGTAHDQYNFIDAMASCATLSLDKVNNTHKLERTELDDRINARAASLMFMVLKASNWTVTLEKLCAKSENFSYAAQRDVANAVSSWWHAPLLLRDMLLGKGEWKNTEISPDNVASTVVSEMYDKWKYTNVYAPENENLFTPTCFKCTEFRQYMRANFIHKATPGNLRAEGCCNDGKRWMREHLEEDVKYDIFDCWDADEYFPHESYVVPIGNVFTPCTDEEMEYRACDCDDSDCEGGCQQCDICERWHNEDEGCDHCCYCDYCDTEYDPDDSQCNCERCSHCDEKSDNCECVFCSLCSENRDAGDCDCEYCDTCNEYYNSREECECDYCDTCKRVLETTDDDREFCECISHVLPISSDILPNMQSLPYLYDGGTLVVLPFVTCATVLTEYRSNKPYVAMLDTYD